MVYYNYLGLEVLIVILPILKKGYVWNLSMKKPTILFSFSITNLKGLICSQRQLFNGKVKFLTTCPYVNKKSNFHNMHTKSWSAMCD